MYSAIAYISEVELITFSVPPGGHQSRHWYFNFKVSDLFKEKMNDGHFTLHFFKMADPRSQFIFLVFKPNFI